MPFVHIHCVISYSPPPLQGDTISRIHEHTHTHTHTPFILKDEEIEHIEFKLSLKFQNSNLDLLHCPL